MKEFKEKHSVGAKIVQGLKEFADALENGEPVAERFNCRVVELDLRPTPYSPDLVREARKLLRASQVICAFPRRFRQHRPIMGTGHKHPQQHGLSVYGRNSAQSRILDQKAERSRSGKVDQL